MSRNNRSGVAPRTARGLQSVTNKARRETMPDSRSWYRIGDTRVVRNESGEATDTEVWIYDEIGFWGVSASDFAQDLRDIDSDSITLRLNSPGGEVYDGIAIMNALLEHKAAVTVKVDALAASIASVIAMAGDTVIMGAHAEFMIHDASTIGIGNAQDMRDVADMLDRVSDNIAQVYSERAGGTPADWRKQMLAETWFSAEEAVKAGLADKVSDPPKLRKGADDDESDDIEDAHRKRMLSRWDMTNYRYGCRAEAPAPALVPVAQARPDGPVGEDEPPAPEAVDDPEGVAFCEDHPEQELDADGGCAVCIAEDEEPVDDKVGFGGLIGEAIRQALADQNGEGIDLGIFHEAIRGITDAPEPVPAPVAPTPPPPAPEPAPTRLFPADAAPADAIEPDLFRAAILLAANDAPAVPSPPVIPEKTNPEEDLGVVDPDLLYNSLREAMK